MKGWVVSIGLACAIAISGGSAQAIPARESFDVLTSTPDGNGLRWRIDRPNPRSSWTHYSAIRLRTGDRVTIDAGGCVQTGGRGKTWKRYVDPIGRKADKQYHALLDIPGTTLGAQRLQLWLRRPMTITRDTALTLGYTDDDYQDNGYWGHDDGNEGQCKDVGAAWLTVHVERGASATRPGVPAPRYNEILQRSAHNAYAPSKPSLRTQLEDGRIRSLELDIHHSRMGLTAPANDFLVYHNALLSPGSSCATLSRCLAELAEWHDRHPEHEATTVFIDLKDPWIRAHSGASLEHQLRARLPGLVATPSSLVEDCPRTTTLREALETCGWPTTDALRGKFLFVLTGDRRQLDAYAGSAARAATRALFIAPEIRSEREIALHDNAVFFNLDSDHYAVGRAAHAHGFVSRVYFRSMFAVHGINDAKNWRLAADNQIHHIATDLVEARSAPFSTTANVRGWPFRCMLRDCNAMAER